jgi:hypothetical protein
VLGSSLHGTMGWRNVEHRKRSQSSNYQGPVKAGILPMGWAAEATSDVRQGLAESISNQPDTNVNDAACKTALASPWTRTARRLPPSINDS